MRLSTIWTIKMMSLSERLRRTRDWGTWKIAAHLPLRLRFMVTMLEIGKATMESEDVPATPLEEILKNLEAPKSLT